MTREEIEELKGLAASMGLYDDKNPCKRAVVLGKAIKALEQEPTTKNDLGVDWDELKRKILMEVDGGTDDKYLRYADVCDRISDSIDEYIADMREVVEE